MFAVDNTLRPASQTTNELVPSRYALQIGAIDVLVVSDGVLPLSPKSSSGRRPISPTPPCRRRCRTCSGRPPRAS